MAEPISGTWKQTALPGQAAALQWGTGINPIHSVYGEGPPLSVTGRLPGPDSPTLLLDEPPESITAEQELAQWGYTLEDMPQGESYRYLSEHPNWYEPGPRDTGAFPPDWPSAGDHDGGIRFIADNYGSEVERGRPAEFPSETVSEGWTNKNHSQENNAEVSDPSQYERQTSMQQRNAVRNNQAAQTRETDDAREDISSRLAGMKLRTWSTGERTYDMFPYQQTPGLPRVSGQWARVAGTGYPGAMLPNEMYISLPIERAIPPDPYLGGEEITIDQSSAYANPEDLAWGVYE
ncbi:MAG: hypothetical protein J2P31_15495 [Blastocatellia bacterium]|nr:hypothetical protein [Blastocatellia bacterium]